MPWIGRIRRMAAGGVLGTLVALAISPLLGALAALLIVRGLRRAARRATRRWSLPVRGGQWTASAALAFSHGSNDAQKAVGVAAALLVADGRLEQPVGADVAGAGVRGGAHGRHSARRLADHPHRGPADLPDPFDRWTCRRDGGERSHPRGLLSRRPGVHDPGRRFLGRRARRRPPTLAPHRWAIVRQMGLAWLVTLPATAALAAILFELWSGLS